MSRVLTLRRRSTEKAVPDVGSPEERTPIATAQQQVVSTLAAKAATVLLMAALVCGPAGLAVAGWVLYSSAAPPLVASVQVQDLSPQRAAAGEFAERVVVAWLTTPRGQEAKLTGLVQVPSVTLPQVPFKVADPTVSAIEQVDGVWSVTVAVTVTDQRKQPARRFFQVPVLVVPGAEVTALSLPAPVAGPTVGVLPRLSYRFQVDPAGPVAQTAAQFLGAYVAGQGDVTRYVSPTVQIHAVTPPPYTAVQVTDLAGDTDIDTADVPKDRTRLRVLVGADASVSSKQQVSVTYALTLLARAGRWEVAAIDPTPALSSRPSGTATPGAPAAPDPGPAATLSSTTPPSR
jgi:hypothetical protein